MVMLDGQTEKVKQFIEKLRITI